ncbi:hypothetical protein OAL55_01425 [Verrucomicrobiales bacterium]|nr:hypothetical protein [Verrucomicrobiales bacterium]MDC0321999.1 hypothetical protein [Verrucomicrobiales bacterium]
MQKIRFEEAVKIIRERDGRFDADAYLFLRDALDHTVKELRSDEMEEHRHVTGPELLHGTTEYALKEYGPMALTVLESWGITSGNDIGGMVFQLIEVGAFGQSPDDSPNDFMDVIDLEKELTQPYRPQKPVVESAESRQNQPATKSEA